MLINSSVVLEKEKIGKTEKGKMRELFLIWITFCQSLLFSTCCVQICHSANWFKGLMILWTVFLAWWFKLGWVALENWFQCKRWKFLFSLFFFMLLFNCWFIKIAKLISLSSLKIERGLVILGGSCLWKRIWLGCKVPQRQLKVY